MFKHYIDEEPTLPQHEAILAALSDRRRFEQLQNAFTVLLIACLQEPDKSSDLLDERHSEPRLIRVFGKSGSGARNQIPAISVAVRKVVAAWAAAEVFP